MLEGLKKSTAAVREMRLFFTTGGCFVNGQRKAAADLDVPEIRTMTFTK